MGNFLLQAKTLGHEIKENLSARSFTTVKTGGNARYFTSPDTAKKLSEITTLAVENGLPYKIVGNGSNILVSDKGYSGLIVSTAGVRGITLSDGKIRVACGESINSLVKFAVKHGFTGIEGLYGIPATVGGAIVQNASAFSYSVSDYIEKVESVKNGKLVVRDKGECKFSYRDSAYKRKREIILSATFKFPEGKPVDPENYILRRRNVQPQGKSFGSAFINPKGFSAGDLVDRAGLKGYRVGGATVSPLHANFIVNTGDAKSADIYGLIFLIKKKVYDEFGVMLKEEVEFVGEF